MMARVHWVAKALAALQAAWQQQPLQHEVAGALLGQQGPCAGWVSSDPTAWLTVGRDKALCYVGLPASALGLSASFTRKQRRPQQISKQRCLSSGSPVPRIQPELLLLVGRCTIKKVDPVSGGGWLGWVWPYCCWWQ
jgi:hypothetical protein